jgi:hypothetical protein
LTGSTRNEEKFKKKNLTHLFSNIYHPDRLWVSLGPDAQTSRHPSPKIFRRKIRQKKPKKKKKNPQKKTKRNENTKQTQILHMRTSSG